MTKANTAGVRGKLAQRAQNQQQAVQKAPAQTGASNGANGNGGGQTFSAVIKKYLNQPDIKYRIEEILRNRAPQFMSSIINLVNADPNLQRCDPMTIISSCMVAATLDLPIDRNLGYAWIVPYWDSKTNRLVATFQMGWKGYVQLALRTGKYRRINAIPIYEGELVSWNPLTEELVYDQTKRKSDRVIGYAGFFLLVNGFEKVVYWSREQIEAHRDRFSKQKDSGAWKTDFDAMALKTVIRNLLSKWGILSIEMQQAYARDVAEPTEDGLAPQDSSIIDADFTFTDGTNDSDTQPNDDDTQPSNNGDTQPANDEPANGPKPEGAAENALGLNLGDDPFAD